jgi:hypothetical protein
LKKLTSSGAAGFAALVAVLAMVGFQSPAQAYPEARIDLRVDHQTVRSGESFTATGSSNVKCAWALEWDKAQRRGTSSDGSDFVTSFRAKNVKTTTTIPLHGTCTYDADQTPGARSTTWERTIDITVQPRRSTQVSAPGGGSGAQGSGAQGSGAQGSAAQGSGAQVSGPQASGTHLGVTGSDLPNAGGPNRLFLVGGLVLLISGATAVTVARRRAEEAEIQASGA